MKIRKFFEKNDYTFLDKEPIILRYWAFDWDDNILDMPTKILMDQKVGDNWLPVEVSTADFAIVRNDSENYRIRNGSIVEAFSEFRDTGKRADRAFIEDVEHSIKNRHFGPAFEKFLKCLSEGSIFSIITARGHEPEIIKEGVEYIIDNILANRPGSVSGMSMADEMFQNLKKFKYWFESGEVEQYRLSSPPSQDPIVQEYLGHCDYFGVSSNSFAVKFSQGSAQTPEQSKVNALKYSIKRTLEYARQLESIMNRPVVVTYGMSDDDPKTSKTIMEFFENLVVDINHEDSILSEYLQKLAFYQTTGGKSVKTDFPSIKTKQNPNLEPDNQSHHKKINKKLRLNETSHQTPGLESSVLPFTKWNNMTQRLYPNSKDAPTDDYHNQMKNQVNVAKDLYKEFAYKRKKKK